MSCNCGTDWRVELLNLATGVRKAYAKPIQFNFEESLNQVGAGSLMLPVRKYRMSDVWPHLTSVAFTRIAGPGATPSAPVGMWLGMVDNVDADSGGALNLGLKSIDSYLGYRILENGYVATQLSQTAIGAALVPATNGIPLTAVDNGSSTLRDVEYLPEDDKVQLDAIRQLTELDNGPDYTLQHTQTGGAWSTAMVFSDRAGNTTPQPLNARRGLTAYSLGVDGADHRTRQIGRGDDDLEYRLTDSGSQYPQFDRSDQWSDIDDLVPLQNQTTGALNNDRHPRAVPSITVADLDMAVRYNLGDVVALTMNHGALQYVGNARLVNKSWSFSDGNPPTCTFSFVPETDPATSVLNAPPEGPRKCC